MLSSLKNFFCYLILISNINIINSQNFTTLKTASIKHNLLIGSAVQENLFSNVKYMNIIREQYNVITAEDSCKFDATEPNPNVFTFSNCDKVNNMEIANNMAFRGHTFVWNYQNPNLLTPLNTTQLEVSMNNHISSLLKHYKSNVFAWDVVNEALSDDSREIFKKSIWHPSIPNYVDKAFIQANMSRTNNVKLFYNDYGAEGFSSKSSKQYNMVKSMKEQGIPIDGIGLQTHINIYYTEANNMKNNMIRLGKLGIDVHITEMDVSCARYNEKCTIWSDTEKEMQAQVYAAVLQACLDSSYCKSFQTWGVSDNFSWIGVNNHPLLFDENYLPKPAFYALLDTLNGDLKCVNSYYKRIGQIYTPPNTQTSTKTTPTITPTTTTTTPTTTTNTTPTKPTPTTSTIISTPTTTNRCKILRTTTSKKHHTKHNKNS
jgi:endo-1,4-beta-xylanase